MRSLLLVGTAVLAGLLPLSASAAAKATWKDRFDQIISTFMGDPAASVDIDLKHVLDTWRGMHPKPLEGLSVEEARQQPTPIDAAAKLLAQHKQTLNPYDVTSTDTTFPGPDGPLKVRVYKPAKPAGAAAEGGGTLPVVVFYHGGGFVLENGASTDASSRAIAALADVIVVAPDYRLAPEYKFPAAQQDALAAYRWTIGNAATFGGDADKIALAGEGAGGMLATDTAIAARRAGLPKAAGLVLITPASGVDLKTNSWLEDKAARPWNDKAVAWALKLFLPQQSDAEDPRIDIVGKTNVDGLPPTTIVTAEIDPLRSDGERLGGKLKIATVPVSMRDYPGVTHDFFGMGAAVEKAAQAQRFVADQLKRDFFPPSTDAVALQDLGIAPYPEAPDPATTPPPSGAPSVPGEGAKMQSKQ